MKSKSKTKVSANKHELNPNLAVIAPLLVKELNRLYKLKGDDVFRIGEASSLSRVVYRTWQPLSGSDPKKDAKHFANQYYRNTPNLPVFALRRVAILPIAWIGVGIKEGGPTYRPSKTKTDPDLILALPESETVTV